jgi:hypothetical protein
MLFVVLLYEKEVCEIDGESTEKKEVARNGGGSLRRVGCTLGVSKT